MLFLQIFQNPALGLVMAVGIIIAISIHEFAHAWMALYLGDRTAESAGRLTMNPLAHLDLVGTVLLFLVGFGWGKPVPVNPHNLQKGGPYAYAWVSLAGPLSNVILALALSIALAFIVPNVVTFNGLLQNGDLLAFFFYYCIFINLALAVFNLIPVAPLDGSKILAAIMGRRQDALETYSRFGPIILIAVLILGRSILGQVFSFLTNSVIGLFVG